MISGRVLWCVVIVAVWHVASSASLPPSLFARLDTADHGNILELDPRFHSPAEVVRGRVREGAPPPLCGGRCSLPSTGPVCAFDAAGTARTFGTLCELEAASCRESTYYAITSLGEC